MLPSMQRASLEWRTPVPDSPAAGPVRPGPRRTSLRPPRPIRPSPLRPSPGRPSLAPLARGRRPPRRSRGRRRIPGWRAGTERDVRVSRHGGRPPSAGQARRTARRPQPGARAADQDGPGHAPQGRRPGDRARLRHRRGAARRHAAQERRPVHHPSAGGGHDPRRARHEPRDDLRRAAARHHRGHRLHARRAAPRVRRRDRRAGRRRDQAGQGQVRRRRAGRDRAQDGGRDVPRHQGPRHQARGPPAQHADAPLPAAAEAGAEVARGAGDIRAARAPAGHEHRQVGT